jgi:WD40 repeat protein
VGPTRHGENVVEENHFLAEIGKDREGSVDDVAFSSTGDQVAIGTESGTTYLLDTKSSELQSRLVLRSGGILSLACSPNDQEIALGTMEAIGRQDSSLGYSVGEFWRRT